MVVATVRAGVDAAQAEREMDRVVAEFVKQGPTEAELQRARARLTSQFVRGAERLGGFGGRSDILAESLTFDGRTEGYLDRLERVSTATAGDVRQAAQRWLDAPHYTLTVHPAETRQAGATAMDRTVLPPLGDPPDVAFPAVQRTQLVQRRHGAAGRAPYRAARQRLAGRGCRLRGRRPGEGRAWRR